MAASLLYNSTHSCCCKFISLTFASFVAGNGRHVFIKWVGLPKLGGFDRTPRTPPGYGSVFPYKEVFLRYNLARMERLAAQNIVKPCLLYTSPSPRDATLSRMPSSA